MNISQQAAAHQAAKGDDDGHEQLHLPRVAQASCKEQDSLGDIYTNREQFSRVDRNQITCAPRRQQAQEAPCHGLPHIGADPKEWIQHRRLLQQRRLICLRASVPLYPTTDHTTVIFFICPKLQNSGHGSTSQLPVFPISSQILDWIVITSLAVQAFSDKA